MFVQPIAMINCRKPQFTAAPRKEGVYYNPNDRVTIQDLYDSEDRIMEHQEKLIREQSSQIAKTLNMMAGYIVAPTTSSSREFGIELDKLGIADRSDSRRHSRGNRTNVFKV